MADGAISMAGSGGTSGGGGGMMRMSSAERAVVRELGEHMFATLGFDAARGSRLREAYHKAIGSGDAELSGDREAVVTFSRSLKQRSPVYRSFLTQLTLRTIGKGLWPEPVAGDADSERGISLFRRWAKRDADARRRESWGALQRSAMMEALVTGDVLVHRIVDDGVPRVQLIEGERIVSPTRGTDTREMRSGVRVNSLGAALSYCVAPWDSLGGYLEYGRCQTIDAGSASLLCLYRDRISQARGTPYLVECLTRIADAEEVHIKITAAMKLAAVLAFVTKSGSPAATMKLFSKAIGSSGSGGSGGD